MVKKLLAMIAVTLLLGGMTHSFLQDPAEKSQENILILNADLGIDTINKNIYGHFSEHLGRCIYRGYWVGEDSPIPNTRGIRKDIVTKLHELR